MIHTMIKVEFGLDFRVLNEAVDLLVNIIEARILNLMDGTSSAVVSEHILHEMRWEASCLLTCNGSVQYIG